MDRLPRVPAAVALAALALWACRGAEQVPEIPPGEDPLRWTGEMQAFAEQDRTEPLPEGGVVFVGSSSIRFWRTLAEDMAPVPVRNRGFGGSRLFDAIWWSRELVGARAPSAVVVFSGTNDLAGERPKTAEEVRDLFLQLVARLRASDADLPIAYIAITPTLARSEHIPAVREANRLIRLECESDPRLEFIDPTPDLTDAEGRPDAQWFVFDRLHLNRRGYEVWTRHVRPVVLRLHGAERAHGAAR